MTEPTRAELMERIETLERRVTALEEQDGGNQSPGVENGHDRRDRAVLEHVREHGDPGPRGTVELFKSKTDINREKTAQRRAKELRRTETFREATQ